MHPSNSAGLSLCSEVCWLLGFALIFCHPWTSYGQVSNSVVTTCNATGITVTIRTKGVFHGSIFASGSFFNPNCRVCYAKKATKVPTLFLPYTQCGNLLGVLDGDAYISNAIVLQTHCLFETGSDTVHNISCKLPHPNSLDKPNHFHGSHPVQYTNGHLKAWMDFLHKGNVLGVDVPNSLLVGDDFTVVVHLKDGQVFNDLQVERCWVYDGETIPTSRYTVLIYDKQTCQRSKWVSGFNYTKLNKDSEAVSYGFMKAFKFPHAKDLHFTCTIQVCTTSCLNNCFLPRFKSNKYLNRQKRSTPDDDRVNNLSKRNRLMKATIKALGTKLMEKNKENESNSATRFNRRIYGDDKPLVDGKFQTGATTPKDETTTATLAEETTPEIWNDVMFFNLTNNIVVYSSRDLITGPGKGASSVSADCVSHTRYAVVAGLLSTITFFLILTCIGLVFYIRKERKKTIVDNFLLYNIY